jgi:hypothetical protein
MGNSRQFSAEIDEAIKKEWVAKFVQFHRTIALDCYKAIQTDSRAVAIKHGSPVMTGRYSGSHTIAINSVDTSVLPPAPKHNLNSKSPPSARLINAKPLSSVSAILQKLKAFDYVTIANSLPYAEELELGFSKFKAPNGVYDVTVKFIEEKFANAKL